MIDVCLEYGTERVLFANADWCVASDGMEHRASGYFIGRSALGGRRQDGLWTWPTQVAEKSWYVPRHFREAFLRALDLFGLEADEDLARSFALASDTRKGSGRAAEGGFVALGAVLRPRSSQRKRSVPGDARGPAARRISATDRRTVEMTG